MDPDVAAAIRAQQQQQAAEAAVAAWEKLWGLKWRDDVTLAPVSADCRGAAETLVAEVPENVWEEAWMVAGPLPGKLMVLRSVELLNGDWAQIRHTKTRVSRRNRTRWAAHGARPVRSLVLSYSEPEGSSIYVDVVRSPLMLRSTLYGSASGELFVQAVAARIQASHRGFR